MHECDTAEWHFVITQIAGPRAPASISVAWASGHQVAVALDKVTGHTAHYATTAQLASTVTSAAANIYAKWSGQFNLSHGPCGNPAQEPAKGHDRGKGHDPAKGHDQGKGHDQDKGHDQGKGQDPAKGHDPAKGNGGGKGPDQGKGNDQPRGDSRGTGHTPVNVCHATGSATNPYVFITVDDDSTKLRGHLMHRNEPRSNKPADLIGDYTDAHGVFHKYDGVITDERDCGAQDPNRTVSAVSPTVTQAECKGNHVLTKPSFTIVSTTGVEYFVRGDKVTGTVEAVVGSAIAVEAKPTRGHVLDGNSTFSLVFAPNPACVKPQTQPIPVTAVDPSGVVTGGGTKVLGTKQGTKAKVAKPSAKAPGARAAGGALARTGVGLPMGTALTLPVLLLLLGGVMVLTSRRRDGAGL